MKRGISISKPLEIYFSCGKFDLIEYCKSTIKEGDMEIIKEEVVTLSNYLEKYNMKLNSFHMPFGNSDAYKFEPASFDEGIRAETFENMKMLLKIISPLKPSYIVVHGSLGIKEEDRAEKLDILCSYLKKLCGECAKFGISVALETLKPRCLGRSLEEHLYINEKVNCENFGICLDTNHLLREDNIKFIEGAGQYILGTHLSDYDMVEERHWYPGRGINDWSGILSALKEKNYKGPYLFEVHFPKDGDRAEEIETLINLWENLCEK